MNQSAIYKFCPSFIRQHIENRPGLQKILANIGWLFFDKIFRMGIGLAVGVWVARYLAPERFGLLSYVTAFVGLFMPLGKLGVDGIVIRDIVRSPDDAKELLGSSFLLMLVGSLLIIIMSFCTIVFLRPNEKMVWLMVAVVACGYIFRSFEVINLWFRSQLKSKFMVIAQNAAILLNSLFKIFLILAGAKVFYFALAFATEGVFAAIGLIFVYHISGGKLRQWQPQIDRSKSLLKEGWPLIFASIFALIYLQIDQIMLGQMLGNKALGIYSAAVRISSVFYFIPMAITHSVFPSLVESKKRGEQFYYQRMEYLFILMAIFSYAIAIPIGLFSNPIIKIMYGMEYLEAGHILSVHIFSAIILFIGIARGPWVTIEGYFKFVMFSNLAAGIVNIILNILFINKFGIIGAAYATLISYFVTYIGSSLFAKNGKRIFKFQIKALFLLNIWQVAKLKRAV